MSNELGLPVSVETLSMPGQGTEVEPEVTGLDLLEQKSHNTDDLSTNAAIAFLLVTDGLDDTLTTSRDLKILEEDILDLAPTLLRSLADETDRKAAYASLFHDLWTHSHVTPTYLAESWLQLAGALEGYKKLRPYISYDERLHIRDNFRPLIAWAHHLSLKVVDKRLAERRMDHEGGRISQELDSELFGYLCDMYLDYQEIEGPAATSYLALAPDTCRRLKAEAQYFYALNEE